VLLLALPLTGRAQASSAAPISCPAVLKPGSIRIDAGTGWDSFVEFPLNLYEAGMSGGPPASLAILRGEQQHRSKHLITTRYTFTSHWPSGGKWLDCRYGEAGEISISRRLDDGVRECTISEFQAVPGNPRRIDIACK